MGIEFKIRRFAYPIGIIRLRRFLEKSQWFSEEELKEYQNKRLKQVIKHAYENVPYYRNLFDERRLKPDDFRDADDLTKLPLFTKDIIKKNFSSLTAANAGKFKPSLYETSGTTQESLKLYLDKPAHILEFCYYWRHWSWGGYRLGDPFLDFSFEYFNERNIEDISSYRPLTRHLLFNSTQISLANLDRFVAKIRKHKPIFLKGLPSILTTFALLLEKAGYTDISFKAAFTVAEMLLPHQKQIIEKVLHCRILDSYSHMESAVAVSQCEHGNYHINSEYGVFSIEEDEKIESHEGESVGEIIGTSLHNFAMPFLRYRTGDLAVKGSGRGKCPCGRGLPLVKKILGRTLGVFITPDNRFVSGMAMPIDTIDGILWYQVIQESKKEFTIKITRRDDISEKPIEEKVTDYYQKILGQDIELDFQFVPLDHWAGGTKHNPIISRLDMMDFI